MSNKCLCCLQKISSMESPRSHASEVDRSDPLGHSASSSAVHRQPQSECQEDSECLRGAVRSLKGEQKALQVQLQEREYVGRVQRAPPCFLWKGVPTRLTPFLSIWGKCSAHGSNCTNTFCMILKCIFQW